MPITKIHKLYGVRLDDVEGSPVIIGGIIRQDLNTEPVIRRSIATGNIYAENAEVEAMNVVGEFVTTDLKGALDNIPVAGLCVNSDGSHNGLELYAQKQQCNGPVAGANHRRYRIRQCTLVPTSLVIGHRADAQIGYTIRTLGDGTNDPIEANDSETLPDLPTVGVEGYSSESKFIMHSMAIAGVTVLEKTNITIAYGAQTSSVGADGETYDSFASIDGLLPTITVAGLDIEYFTTQATLAGKDAPHATSEIVLKKRGTADATAEHIKITFSGTAYPTQIFSASDQENAASGVGIDLFDDGTNGPLTVDTSYAIP